MRVSSSPAGFEDLPMEVTPYTAEPVRTTLAVSYIKRVCARGWISLRRSCSRDLIAQALLELAFKERLAVEERKRLKPYPIYKVSAPVAARLVILLRVASPPLTRTTTWLEAAERGYDTVVAYGLAQRLRDADLIEKELFPVDELSRIEYPRDVIVLLGARGVDERA